MEDRRYGEIRMKRAAGSDTTTAVGQGPVGVDRLIGER